MTFRVQFFCPFLLHFRFLINRNIRSRAETPTAVEIRCTNSPVIILPFITLKYHYLRLFGNKDAENVRHFFLFVFSETPARKNIRFRGSFENPIGYTDQKKHSTYGAWENMFLKKLHGLLRSSTRGKRVRSLFRPACPPASTAPGWGLPDGLPDDSCGPRGALKRLKSSYFCSSSSSSSSSSSCRQPLFFPPLISVFPSWSFQQSK